MFDITAPLTPDALAPQGGPLSLQKRLSERIQQAILSGQLPPGEALMSSRALAKELGVSRNTVVNVYEHLAAQGYILADRQGTRVAPVPGAERSVAPPTTPDRPAVQLAERIGPLLDNPPPQDADAPLSPGMPALREFPLTAWRRSLDRTSRQLAPRSLSHSDPTGEPALREVIARHLHVARGVRCDASRIIVTEGAKQALELCVTLLANPGATVWMEEPGYRGASNVFTAGNLRTVTIGVDQEGILVPDSAWQTDRPRLIYITPAHQYPTGAVLSVSRRLELISRAEKAGAWLIEDDYDGDFRHSGAPIASMQGLTDDAPVLYIGSFSKTLFPSLRLGFVVLPADIMKQARPALNEILNASQQLQQLALADFIKGGEFGRHLGRMRRLYRERQRILRDALSADFAPEQIFGGKSGMHLTLKLAPETDDKKIAELAHQQGLGVHALSWYFMGAATASGLVIGYGNTPAQAIPGAVQRLTGIIRRYDGV